MSLVGLGQLSHQQFFGKIRGCGIAGSPWSSGCGQSWNNVGGPSNSGGANSRV